MIYVILGMHKSGTTLVSRMLHRSGISMVADEKASVSYDQGNKYERLVVKDLNDEILGSKNVSSIEIKRPAVLSISDMQREQIQDMVMDLNGRHKDWGFKDPRTCLTYPLWAELLGDHKIIVILRDPGEIWHNYSSTNPFKSVFRAWRLMDSWIQANMSILKWIQSSTMPVLVLKYRELMNDQESVDRLSEFVGRPLQDERRPNLCRGRNRGVSVLRLMSVLYQCIRRKSPVDILKQFESWK